MKYFINSLFTLLIIFLSFSSSLYSQIIEENETNDKLVEEFGYALNEAISNEDTDAYLELFSAEAFTDRIDDVNARNKRFKKGYIEGVLNGMKGLPQRIINESQDGYYDFVNYRYDSVSKTYFALFRLYGVESGINYHDYRIVKNPNKDSFLFSDAYIYLSGEYLSETLKRLYQFSFDSSAEGSEENFTQLKQVIMLRSKGNYKESLEIANSIKGDLKDDKFFMILKSVIAANVDEEVYLNSLKNLIDKHGEDPTILLQKVDYHIYLGDYDAAQKNLELLMEETGDDFLYFMIGSLNFEQGEYEAAQKNFKYIIDNFDPFFEAQSLYLYCLTIRKDYEKAAEYLDALSLEYEKEDLIFYLEEPEEDGSNIFDDFVKSETYLEWKE